MVLAVRTVRLSEVDPWLLSRSDSAAVQNAVASLSCIAASDARVAASMMLKFPVGGADSVPPMIGRRSVHVQVVDDLSAPGAPSHEASVQVG